MSDTAINILHKSETYLLETALEKAQEWRVKLRQIEDFEE